MRNKNRWIISIFWAAFLVFFQGCVTTKAPLRVEKSLPQEKLAYYNDAFDKLRKDLWDKAGYLYSKEQMTNFKLADMRAKDGRLIIETKTGCFSKAGLASKYALRGDFDIQVDCHIDFLEGLQDMDHLLNFLVLEKGKEFQALNGVIIGLCKRGGLYESFIFSGQLSNGTYHRGELEMVKSFHGTLRIVRVGEQVSTLYRKKGDNAWKKMDTFRSQAMDVILGFKLQNFVNERTYIKARHPITAIFDNLRINAAQEIIEEEI